MIIDIYDIAETDNERTNIVTDTANPKVFKQYVFRNDSSCDRRAALIERLASIGLDIGDFAFDPKIKEHRKAEKEKRMNLIKSRALTAEDADLLIQNWSGVSTMEFF